MSPAPKVSKNTAVIPLSHFNELADRATAYRNLPGLRISIRFDGDLSPAGPALVIKAWTQATGGDPRDYVNVALLKDAAMSDDTNLFVQQLDAAVAALAKQTDNVTAWKL